MAKTAILVTLAGFGYAAASAWGHDAARTVHQRALTQLVSRVYDPGPGPVLAISTPVWWAHTDLLTRSDAVLAPWHPSAPAFGPDLVHRALVSGFAVVSFQPHATETLLAADPDLQARPFALPGAASLGATGVSASRIERRDPG